jgi:hypothetical protein
MAISQTRGGYTFRAPNPSTIWGRANDADGLWLPESVTQQPGRVQQPGWCLEFDGVNNFVEVTGLGASDLHFHDGADDEAFSVAVWCMLSATGTGVRYILCKADSGATTNAEYGLCFTASDDIELQLFNGGNIAQYLAATTDNTYENVDVWQHIVVTYDGSEATDAFAMYVNGVSVDYTGAITGSYASGMTATADSIRIGGRTDTTLEIPAFLFDLRIYDKELSAEEVGNIYYSTSVPGRSPQTYFYGANLAAHWRMDERAGETRFAPDDNPVIDTSGNGFHGLPDNFAAAERYEGVDVPCSFVNEAGYHEAGTTIFEDEFSSDTWTHGAGMSIADGKLKAATAGTQESYKALTGLAANRLYKITAFFSSVTSGDPRIVLTGTNITSNTDYLTAALGQREDIVWTRTTASATARITVRGGSAGATWEMDRIKVEEVGPIPCSSATPTEDLDGRSLTYTGAVPRDAGLVNSACGHFDGLDDYAVASGRVTSGSVTNLSVSAWVLRDTDVGGDSIADENSLASRGWMLSCTADPAVRVNLSSNGSSYTTTVNTTEELSADGLWHHIAFTYDGTSTTIKIFIDGYLSETATSVDSSIFNTVAPFTIGAYTTSINEFDGKIADVRLWDGTTLTDAEVAALYAGTSPSTAPTGHWPIAEGAGGDGDTTHDVSGNGNHLTLTNITEGTFWDTAQDNYHHNITRGYGTNDGGGGNVAPFIPYLADESAAAATAANLFPSGAWHNGCETELDFTGGVLTPWKGTRYHGYWVGDGTAEIAVPIAYMSDLENSSTISVYIRCRKPEVAGVDAFFGIHDGTADGTIYFAINTDNVYIHDGAAHDLTTAEIPDDDWVEILVTVSGSDAKVYIDGELKESDTLTNFATFDGTLTAAAIAGHWTGANYFPADIDRVIVSTAVETQSSIFNSANKVFDYRFDDPRTLIDFSGNDRHIAVPASGWTADTNIALPTTYEWGDALPDGMTHGSADPAVENDYKLFAETNDLP